MIDKIIGPVMNFLILEKTDVRRVRIIVIREKNRKLRSFI